MRAIRWYENNCDARCKMADTTVDGLAVTRCRTHRVWWYTPDMDEVYDV